MEEPSSDYFTVATATLTLPQTTLLAELSKPRTKKQFYNNNDDLTITDTKCTRVLFQGNAGAGKTACLQVHAKHMDNVTNVHSIPWLKMLTEYAIMPTITAVAQTDNDAVSGSSQQQQYNEHHNNVRYCRNELLAFCRSAEIRVLIIDNVDKIHPIYQQLIVGCIDAAGSSSRLSVFASATDLCKVIPQFQRRFQHVTIVNMSDKLQQLTEYYCDYLSVEYETARLAAVDCCKGEYIIARLQRSIEKQYLLSFETKTPSLSSSVASSLQPPLHVTYRKVVSTKISVKQRLRYLLYVLHQEYGIAIIDIYNDLIPFVSSKFATQIHSYFIPLYYQSPENELHLFTFAVHLHHSVV